MAFLINTEISNNKIVYFALRKIFGLGKYRVQLICKKAGFAYNCKILKLTNEQIIQLVKIIETLNFSLSNDLKKNQALLLNSFIEIKLYKGLRRLKGLPVRGQRTHTNAKTAKRR